MSEILFKLQEQGASIVPIVKDKQSIPGWPEFGTKALTRSELEEVIEMQPAGYAIMMGYGGFNCIDFDSKNMPEGIRSQFFPTFWEAVPEWLKSQLTVQGTRSSGNHLIYKCAVSASMKLSVSNPTTGRPVVETLSARGYCMIEPSPGYQVVSGSLAEVQEISEADHTLLWNLARQTAESFFKPVATETQSVTHAGIEALFDYEELCENSPTTEMRSADGFSPTTSERPTNATRDSIETSASKSRSVSNSDYRSAQFISASAAYIEQAGIDITADYDNWKRIGYAVANELGASGREQFHKFSANHPEYDIKECDKMYDGILHSISVSQVEKPITGATLRHIMMENGIVLPREEEGNKTALKTQHTVAYIRGKGLYRNTFTNKVEKPNGDPLTESDLDTIFVDLRSEGLCVSKMEVGSIINSYYLDQTDPLKDWLQSTVASADKAALDLLLDSLVMKIEEENKRLFYRKLVTKWLLQIPAMIFDGSMPRLVLVLIGGTYIGKSEFFRRLLPKNLSKYYAESALDREKDSDIMMTDHLLINVDELAGIMKSPITAERFKALSSAPDFTLRPPYGKVSEKFLRKAILCGTSNKIDVIQDQETGNSRIIPLELTKINQELYNSIRKEALFGELARMYREVGQEHLRLTPDELKMLESESGDYTALNVEQELILRFFRPGSNFMTVTEITDYIIEHTKLPVTSKKISRELIKLKFEKDRKWVKDVELDGNARNLNGYYVEKMQLVQAFEEVKNSIIQRRMIHN